MPSLLPLLFTALPLAAQDAIGVTFSGQVLRLDTATGAVTVLATGTPGKNCLTFTNDNRLWTVVRPNPTSPVFHLAVIDPFTGGETLPFGAQNVGDLRAMCIGRFAGGLFAVRDSSPFDELVHIDTDTGVLTVVGPCNHSGIQGLEDPFGGAKAWDVNAGMLQLNLTTGFTNDPFLTPVDPPGLQYMVRHPVTNERYVGRGSLYRLNTSNGTTTFVCTFAGDPDIRGLEFTSARDERFGTACLGANGALFIDLPNPFNAGEVMTVISTNHLPGTIGLQLTGLSEDFYGAIPLPLALDPLLGTNNCFLNVSPELTLVGIADGSGVMAVDLFMPLPLRFVQVYVQHLTLEAVPGGLAFTQGLRVRSAL
jgi:hypothetical protein